VDQVTQMGPGLNDASAFLLAMRADARDPSMAGFYIPPQILQGDEFETAATMFVSRDGHAVRYLMQTDLNPFGTEAMDQVGKIMDAARSAQPTRRSRCIDIDNRSARGERERARLRRPRRHVHHHDDPSRTSHFDRAVPGDRRTVVSHWLGDDLVSVGSRDRRHLLPTDPRPTPCLERARQAFIVLVAVGAHYNLLLISRARDEASHGLRSAVIRTVASTGGVITSTGLIFAASMFGLVFGSISGMVQVGFIIGIGLLLDTFLVRTVTMPAMADMVGRANWWPSKYGSTGG
jgi:RND superfamily putative drug exporter